MSKFVQTGDIHIGECRGLPDYLPRHRAVLYQILDYAILKKIPLVIAGDLFHLKSTNHDERKVAAEWVGSIESSGIPAILIPGNHDHLYQDKTQLDFFLEMPLRNIKIVTWHPEVVDIQDVSYLAIPWREYTREELETVVFENLPQMKKKYKVAIVHECVKGSYSDNGWVIPKGIDLPDVPGIDYWAIGDIHKHQNAGLPHAFYAGAPAQFKFNDHHLKGFLEVDLENPTAPVLIPTIYKPMRVISSVSEISEDAYYQVRGSIEEVAKSGQYAQIINAHPTEKFDLDASKFTSSVMDGLPEFLASKGVDAKLHAQAIAWVNKKLTAA